MAAAYKPMPSSAVQARYGATGQNYVTPSPLPGGAAPSNSLLPLLLLAGAGIGVYLFIKHRKKAQS